MLMHLLQINDTEENLCNGNQAALFGDDFRFWIVGPVGLVISIVSVLENTLLFYVFSTSRKLRRQNYVNPVLLAFFDIIVSVTYMLTSQIHLAAFRTSSTPLIRIWAQYIPFFICLQQSVLTICNFLLVIASLERFLANGSLRTRCALVFVVRHKTLVLAIIMLLAFALKATLYFDIAVVENPKCEFAMLRTAPVWLAPEKAPFWSAFCFWLRVTLTVIAPFVVLLYFNVNIVMQLHVKRRKMTTLLGESRSSPAIPPDDVPNNSRSPFPPAESSTSRVESPYQRQNDENHLKPKPSTFRRIHILVTPRHTTAKTTTRMDTILPEHQIGRRRPSLDSSRDFAGNNSSVRSEAGDGTFESIVASKTKNTHGIRVATRTLVMVVGCFLISNSLGTALQIWEFFDPIFLRKSHQYGYVIASDIAALLTILGCVGRLPIYVINDRRIRKALFRAALRRFHNCRCCFFAQKSTFGDVDEKFLEKWSIQIVSNSLRSNITGILSQIDWTTFDGKRSFDQLAILVQNRRRFLVEMTIKLGTVKEIIREDPEEIV